MSDACQACGTRHGEAGCPAESTTNVRGQSRTMPSFPPEVAAPSAPDLVGQMVGEYRVTKLIGEGGMGTVWQGVHPLIEKFAALKVLKPAFSHDPDSMQRFLAEAKAANRIGHPNIVDIFSFGSLPDGSQYFAMEFLVGRSLAAFLEQRKPPSYAEVRLILSQVLDGLEAAHAGGIVHRDLKPDNIYLCDLPNGGFKVKLLDFGVAKFLDGASTVRTTQTGTPIGTPLYMSPEHCRGRGLDRQSDLYSLGCILFEMLVGRPPFDAPSPYEVISLHLTAPVPRPGNLCEMPEDLEEVILRLLEKEKEKRIGSVAQLREVLLPILDRLAGSEPVRQAHSLPPRPAIPLEQVAATRLSQRGRRRSPMLILGGATFALGLAGAILLFGRSRDPQLPAPVAPAPAPVVAVDPKPAPAPEAAPPAPAPPKEAQAQQVQIQLLVSPPVTRFELTVDGKPHRELELQVPRSSAKKVRIRLTSPGFLPFEVEAMPKSDLTLTVQLTRAAAPAPAPAPKADSRMKKFGDL